MARAHEIVRKDIDFARVANAVIFLGEDRLPTASPERLAWLTVEVNAQFPKVDFTKITWDESTCSIPWLLHCLLVLVHHYQLQLTDDVPLIRSLNGIRGEVASRHVKDFGLSPAAQSELESLCRNPNLNPSALHTVLHFLRETNTWSTGIAEALLERALSADPQIREPVIFTLCVLPQSTDVLIAIAAQRQMPVPAAVLDELVKRQHRATIERRLSQTLGDENLMRTGEVAFPNSGPLDWIGDIRLPEVWNKMRRLRSRALELGLPRLVGTVTSTMATIDQARLASTIAGHVSRAPEAWRPWQLTGAIEARQRARLAQAQTEEFQTVVTKLQRKSTEKLLKIWCEGITDLPALRAFVVKVIGPREDVVLQPLGGWGELINPSWPLDRLWDGCLDVVVIADGDYGRDWTRTDRPLSDAGQALVRRLGAAGVSGFVLERYGIENYFEKAAVELVLGPTVAQAFPLADSMRAAEIPGYSKDSNGRIADQMKVDDLKGTDLYDILQELRRRVEAVA